MRDLLRQYEAVEPQTHLKGLVSTSMASTDVPTARDSAAPDRKPVLWTGRLGWAAWRLPLSGTASGEPRAATQEATEGKTREASEDKRAF